MRLIDADAMRQDWLENGENEYVYDTNAVLDSIDAQPTIDAVPVVRCKDCTYRADQMECPMCFEEYTDLSEDEWDSIISDSTVDDGFCHHGKRKDGEG